MSLAEIHIQSYVQGLKLPNCGTWAQKLVGLLGRPIAAMSTLGWPFTPIDLLSLFDKVVVHEVCQSLDFNLCTCLRTNTILTRQLTHARHGGMTFDSKINPSVDGAGFLFSNTGYGEQMILTRPRILLKESGWRNCRKLAPNTPDVMSPPEGKPMNNADSYGLFASGEIVTLPRSKTLEINREQVFV